MLNIVRTKKLNKPPKKYKIYFPEIAEPVNIFRVSDPDPDSMSVDSYLDPEGQKLPTKIEKI
jgi:hypothetical protein